MSEVILVVPSRSERATTLLTAAGRLADLMGDGAHVSVLAVREHIPFTPLAAEALIDEAGAIAEAREQERERVAALKAAFDRWNTGAGAAATAARWIEEEGNSASIVGERGSRADVIVTGPPADEERPARQAFRAALFGTDRPVVVVPPGAAATAASFGRRVAIAWRDDKQAARAAISALRWLAPGAEQVHVLMGVPGGGSGGARPAMPRVFSEHDVGAELHALSITRSGPPFGQVLLAKAHEVGADLLVMGAYAHSPLRELILGGVTRYMLAHADLPVLMRH